MSEPLLTEEQKTIAKQNIKEVMALAKEFLPDVKDGLGMYLEALTDNDAFRKAVVVGLAGQIAKGVYQGSLVDLNDEAGKVANKVGFLAYQTAFEILRFAESDYPVKK